METATKLPGETTLEAENPNLAHGGVRRWLQDYRWDDVTHALTIFWHVKLEQLPDAREAREAWVRESGREMPLEAALQLCRRCQMARPFGRYDCESFVIIAREILKPFLGQMSATLAAAVVVIVGEYVRGCGNEAEMRQSLKLILERFEE